MVKILQVFSKITFLAIKRGFITMTLKVKKRQWNDTRRVQTSKEIKIISSAGKVIMVTVLWDSKGVLLIGHKNKGDIINATSYTSNMLKGRKELKR